ncbi:helix-turn-helix transcriptional regulator [Rhodovulum sp. DZ06]|uniref:helix-turn-helix transcriptional regulator n=1 Tax=Rhodovulum sp. DZ06 TaxID=3425126 RepID=UPI003D359A14
MFDDEQTNAVLRIYDAVTAPGQWRSALDLVSVQAGARAAMIVTRGTGPGQAGRRLMSGEYLAFSKSRHGILYMIAHNRKQKGDWAYLSGRPLHEFTPDTRMHAAEQLDARGDYRFLRRHLGIGRRVGARLSADRLWFDAISLGFDARAAAAPPPEALERAAPLLPHLSKALELSRGFLKLRARENAMLGALDRVGVGLAVVDGAGGLVHSNAAFDAALGEAAGIGRTGTGPLHFRDAAEGAAAQAAIAAAAALAGGDGARGGACKATAEFEFPRRGGGAPLLLDISPLRDGAAEIAPGFAGALLTLVDPDAAPPSGGARVGRAYGLTPAECAVLDGILAGLSDKEIAARLGKAPSTAKNQVAAILEKTGCARRSELIRLVLRAVPPVG